VGILDPEHGVHVAGVKFATKASLDTAADLVVEALGRARR
jgi:hypothetical protein